MTYYIQENYLTIGIDQKAKWRAVCSESCKHGSEGEKRYPACRITFSTLLGKQRKSWSVEQKLAIVLAALSERQSVAEIARQHGVNENQIYRWKDQFLTSGRQGLDGAKAQTVDQKLEAENDQLKKLLGEKTLELDMVKKLCRL